MSNVEFLKQLALFKGLPQHDLERLCSMSEDVTIQPGQWLIRQGDPGGSLYIILDGEFEVTMKSGQQEMVMAVRGPGEVIGEMSLLDKAPRSASVRALKTTHALMINHDAVYQLLTTSASAAMAMFHTMTERQRSNEALMRQTEKMAGLGTLAAGVAHELNNPAAAAARSAAQLRAVLTKWLGLANMLTASGLTSEQTQVVNGLRDEITKRTSASWTMDPLERSDRESELQEWLEDHNVDQAWELAPNLVAAGWDVKTFEPFHELFPDEQLSILAQWLEQGTSVYALLGEVSQSAERISEIVKAVKTYSYLDQAPIQDVNVHEGLENTLVILKHKIKKGVTVKKEYAPNLPRIEALGSELNQAWTNIMDNALDAMAPQVEAGKSAELTLRTYADDGNVVVEIADNGPGIPPEIQTRVFEPFFTTKPPGVGTGLGLHITYNIIVSKHHGSIKAISQPGSTCFRVTLPIHFQRGEASSSAAAN
ncbi:MAG: ATP-binding protein [Chloroflexota bacterium]